MRNESSAEENEYLRAQVRQLQDALGLGMAWPVEWSLSPNQTTMLGVLVVREVATRDAIMCALYGTDPEPPDAEILRVMTFKLRKKLAPHGFTIITHRTLGLSIPAEQRARLRALARRRSAMPSGTP